MAKEPDGHNQLNAFEAALAALRPRGDGLDREQLMFLAGQVSAQPGETHSGGTRLDRWGWPAAFVAMTTVAASLLVTLAVRPPRVVERIVAVPAAASPAAIDRQEQYDRDSPREDRGMAVESRRAAEQPGDWMTFFWASFEDYPSASLAPTDASQYKRLRDLAVSRGLDAWPTPAALATAGSGDFPRSRPACQRELLDELLETSDGHRLELPEASPEATFHPGAKS